MVNKLNPKNSTQGQRCIRSQCTSSEKYRLYLMFPLAQQTRIGRQNIQKSMQYILYRTYLFLRLIRIRFVHIFL